MSFKPNVPPLHFHDVHGSNLVLARNKMMAHRIRDFDSVVYTNRPVSFFEPIVFQITQTDGNFKGSGGLSIGFTNYDPSTIAREAVNNSNAFLLPNRGIWKMILPDSINRRGHIVSFYVDFDGDIFYDINNGKKTYLMSNVDTSLKLWGIVGIFGMVNEILLLGPDSSPIDFEKVIIKKTESRNVSFHENHGEPVCLAKDGTIAYKSQSLFAYVFSNRPFKFNEKLIVSVNALWKSENSKEIFEYGLTTTDPSKIEPNNLPENTGDLLSFRDYWVIYKDRNSYKSGDILIFTLTSEGKFIVVKNCSSRACFLQVDVSQPLWLFLKLNGAVAEISFRESSTRDYFNTLTEKDLLKMSDNNNVNRGSFASTTPATNDSTTMKECLICFEDNVDCVLYRCGHICMCYDCARTSWLRKDFDKCPLCRAFILDIIKTY